jgi:predicted nuclease of predicted toxin-antitoxin system
MRLLADECFDERLAARLRAAGHDVPRVAAQIGSEDLPVAELAERDDRVLLTQDTDFGAVALDDGRPRSRAIG